MGGTGLLSPPCLPPWHLAQREQRVTRGAIGRSEHRSHLSARCWRAQAGNPTPCVIGIRCSLTCCIHREAGSIYLSEPAALSACGRRWRWRGPGSRA